MQRAIQAFLALSLVAAVPASEVAAGQTAPPPQLSDLLQRFGGLEWQIPANVLKLRGYALADELDELGRSEQTAAFFVRFQEMLSDSSLLEVVKCAAAPELKAVVDESLASKVDRLASLIATAFDIIADESPVLGESMMLQTLAATLARLDDRTRPVAERRLLRHSLRGMAALFCIAGRPESIDLQAALLDHAIVGYESVLRCVAGSADEETRGRIIALGLEPIDVDAFDNRAAEIAAGRAAFNEARAIDPTFALPPDPGLVDKLKD